MSRLLEFIWLSLASFDQRGIIIKMKNICRAFFRVNAIDPFSVKSFKQTKLILSLLNCVGLWTLHEKCKDLSQQLEKVPFGCCSLLKIACSDLSGEGWPQSWIIFQMIKCVLFLRGASSCCWPINLLLSTDLTIVCWWLATSYSEQEAWILIWSS